MDSQKDELDADTVDELPTKSTSPKYIGNFETPTNTPSKYKQCYRTEWESMPHFKDWLKPVHGEPTRAFCTYCDKSLHAHRLSLLKHACTARHTKAAQSVFAMKNCNNEILPNIENITVEPSADAADEDSNSDEEVVDEPSEAGDAGEDTSQPPPKVARMDSVHIPPQRSKLSTHVLDTAKGSPVGGLQVSLYKLIDSRWRILSEGFTNPDGRYSEFLQKDAVLSPGRYKMHFDVDRYFVLRKQESLYPFIEIVFDVKSPHEHYHIPLLLSPFGYTTYRGS
ncbi:5-hydroxyisourate hydrolase [Gryllus bimaculatus]|nr:5-hydroxyisourate hydrolase [Gryllus bimaculatus]